MVRVLDTGSCLGHGTVHLCLEDSATCERILGGGMIGQVANDWCCSMLEPGIFWLSLQLGQAGTVARRGPFRAVVLKTRVQGHTEREPHGRAHNAGCP